ASRSIGSHAVLSSPHDGTRWSTGGVRTRTPSGRGSRRPRSNQLNSRPCRYQSGGILERGGRPDLLRREAGDAQRGTLTKAGWGGGALPVPVEIEVGGRQQGVRVDDSGAHGEGVP